jgi:hypothetical protein
MFGNFGSMMGIYSPLMICLFVILMAWSAVWKGIALWKSAGKKHTVWFIVLFITNTLGILDILYIYIFSEMKYGSKEQEKPVRRTVRRRRRR